MRIEQNLEIMPNLYLALVHYPVVNKNGDTIASAVTPMDLHDISRAAKTFGAAGVFAVTPLKDQQRLMETLMSHWTEGAGGVYNPKRREALSLVRVVPTLEDAGERIRLVHGREPVTVATAARRRDRVIGYAALKRKMADHRPYLLMFGTAWGMTDASIMAADEILAPIEGPGTYNHLSVRSAVSIILDRLLGGAGE